MSRKTKSAPADSAQSEAVEAALAKTAAAPATEGGADIPAGGINDKIRGLIRLSKEQGYLTFDDINEALPESVENQEEIDNVLSILQNLEIEILEPDQVEDYKQRMEEAEEEESRSSNNDILDDPVRMYLKQMGQVPLLTREQEVEISKRIETAELKAQEALFQAAVIGGYIGTLGAKLLNREERFDRVVIDKKIESREAYFKGLEKLVQNTQHAEASVAEGWAEVWLGLDWAAIPRVHDAVVRLARVSGDPERDLSPSVRRAIAAKIRRTGGTDAQARALTSFVPVSTSERRTSFGDALPIGLTLDP